MLYKLTCEGQVMQEEQNLGVDIVHGWFTGARLFYILKAYFCKATKEFLELVD